MILLAIDPGPVQSGYVVWDGLSIVDAGKLPNEEMLAFVERCRAEPETEMVVEMIASYGMAVGREVFETCVWIGKFEYAWRKPCVRAFRKDVKLHLCGSARAKDPNVRQALIDRFGAPGTKKAKGATYGLSGDMWAAFAVAVYARDEWYRLRTAEVR
jgi:hypothetical protein